MTGHERRTSWENSSCTTETASQSVSEPAGRREGVRSLVTVSRHPVAPEDYDLAEGVMR